MDPSLSYPLDTLIASIQKEEIQLFDISLHALIEKYRPELTLENKGAPFIAILAHLIYLKSVKLIPTKEEPLDEEEQETPLVFDAGAYSSFQQAAKAFSMKEKEQSAYFLRGTLPIEDRPTSREMMIPLGIEEFSRLFSTLWQEAQNRCSTIVEEEWKVADALVSVRNDLRCGRILFNDLFSLDHSKERLIVTFLAILELMKNQEAFLVQEQTSKLWYITA
jgi:segregation and condensation protein A